MKFIKFRIQNYKGINDTTIELNGSNGSIYTLVGLNESGKTTILEAINNFRPDIDGVHVIAQQSISSEPVEALVPKKNKDNFNDTISVQAQIKMEDSDIAQLVNLFEDSYDFQIDTDSLPHEFSVERCHYFENSRYVRSVTQWDVNPYIKRKKSRKFVPIVGGDEEWHLIVREIGRLIPRIVYFPTFLFDFPEKILISDGVAEVEGNEYFKRMIEDALASLENPLELKTHIVDRVVEKEPDIPFGTWFPSWFRSDEKEQVSSVLSKLSQLVSEQVFGRWSEVLGTDPGQKELLIEHFIEESDTGERQIYLDFKVKDDFTIFKISERSLGFRWFCCFLLFTLFFRGSNSGDSMFLFDEPASNLHSKAQTKLLDCLEVIAAGKNDVIYSTHSHHLINPLWLETAFIITNGTPTDDGILDADFVEENSDIHAQQYKTFIGKNAEKSHYFQPILDRLQVKPSLLEATREGVITEGKSDFYILNWFKKYHENQCTLDFIPVGGATNASSLISLYLGLALRFVFLLDSDREGDQAKKKYLRELPLSENSIAQIGEIFGPSKKTVIEDLISEKMKTAIKKKYHITRITKKHILRAFSEALSGKNDLPNDPETLDNLKHLVNTLKNRLSNQ